MLAVSGPQGKASQMWRNAGTGALCRSGSRQALGAVMSAGEKTRLEYIVGQGEHSVVAHHPPHSAEEH